VSASKADTASRSPLLVVISGPSGVGKDAVLAQMRDSHPEIFFAVTATTRPMRDGEIDGHDYIFLSSERFQELLDSEEFLEHAEVYERRYGIPKGGVREALAEGKDVVVKIDVQGAATVRSLAPDALLVFLAAPSMGELERRLASRETETPEQMALRIETARHEMEQSGWFDCVIINETNALDNTVARIIEVIEKERHHQPPRIVRI
jgi:guanylate kinase